MMMMRMMMTMTVVVVRRWQKQVVGVTPNHSGLSRLWHAAMLSSGWSAFRSSQGIAHRAVSEAFASRRGWQQLFLITGCASLNFRMHHSCYGVEVRLKSLWFMKIRRGCGSQKQL